MCRVFRGWAAEDVRRHDCDDNGTGSCKTTVGTSWSGAEEGRRPLFRKSENQPSSQEVQVHMVTLGAVIASKAGE